MSEVDPSDAAGASAVGAATPRVLTRSEAERAAAEVLAATTRSYVSAASDLSIFVRAEAAERADLLAFVSERACNCRRTEVAARASGDVLVAELSRARAEAYELVADEVEARATERGGP